MVKRLLAVLAASLAPGAALALVPLPPAVQVSPSTPQPGSTLQLVSDGATVVHFAGRAFPGFPLDDGRWRTLVPVSALAPAGKHTLVVESAGGREAHALTLASRRFRTQHIRLSPERADLEETPRERSAIGAALATVSSAQQWTLPFRPPLGGRLSTPYGVRRTYNGVPARDYYHRGYDIAAPRGTPVVAPATGRVILVGTTQRGFRVHGNTLVLDHGQGVVSIYIHLSRVLVREGEMVAPGQRIARVGSSGRASGPHLHWGLYVHGISVDPAPWLAGQICCQAAN